MNSSPAIINPLTLTPGEINFYNREGYLLLPGLLPPDQAAAINRDVVDIMQAMGLTADRLRKAQSSADKLRQTGQYLAGSAIEALVNSAALRGLAGQLMGGPGSVYLPFTAVKAGGGGGRFHFHQDNQYTRFEGPGINIWFALSDMFPENGCLQMVPRSHTQGTLESEESSDKDGHRATKNEPQDFLPVRMRAGDAIAFSRLTLHGSGPNTTEEPRLAYAVQYFRDDVYAWWDGQKHQLKTDPRYKVAPVARIVPPEKKEDLDGH